MSTKQKQTTTSNQTQTAAPPKWTLPGLDFAGGAVTDALKANAGGPSYGGDFVAGMDPARLAAQLAAYDATAGKVGELSTFADTQMRNLFQPRDMRSELDAAIRAAIQPVTQNLQENILPGITNSALQSGAYTNDRALGVVPGQAIRDALDSQTRIAATLGYEGLQAEEDRRLQRAQMLPELTNLVAQMFSSRGDILGAGTALEQQNRQLGINNDLARHQYAIQAPYERIAPAVSLLTALSGNWGEQTSNGTQTTVQKTSGLGPILQGAMGLASMAAGMGAFGNLGGAAGAAGGAAGGAGQLMVNPNLGISSIFGPRRS